MFRIIGLIAAVVLGLNAGSALGANTHSAAVGFVSGLVSIVVLMWIFFPIGALIDSLPARWEYARYEVERERASKDKLAPYNGTREDAIKSIKARMEAKKNGGTYVPSTPTTSVEEEKGALQERIRNSPRLRPPE